MANIHQDEAVYLVATVASVPTASYPRMALCIHFADESSPTHSMVLETSLSPHKMRYPKPCNSLWFLLYFPCPFYNALRASCPGSSAARTVHRRRHGGNLKVMIMAWVRRRERKRGRRICFYAVIQLLHGRNFFTRNNKTIKSCSTFRENQVMERKIREEESVK